MGHVKVELKISSEQTNPNGKELTLGGLGKIHKDGKLLGSDEIRVKIELEGKGVSDILQHFPQQTVQGMFGAKAHLMGLKNVEILISD